MDDDDSGILDFQQGLSINLGFPEQLLSAGCQ